MIDLDVTGIETPLDIYIHVTTSMVQLLLRLKATNMSIDCSTHSAATTYSGHNLVSAMTVHMHGAQAWCAGH